MNQKNNLDAEKLCTNCGLCCTDVFHKFVYLETNNEVEILKNANFSLEYIEIKNKYRFTLPCSAFNGTCSIYSERPLVCKEHECDLLQYVTSNKIDIEDALNVIKKIQNIINDIVPQLSTLVKNKVSNSPGVLMEELLNSFEDESSKNNFMKKNKTLFLQYGIFNFLKHKYFYHNDENFRQL